MTGAPGAQGDPGPSGTAGLEIVSEIVSLTSVPEDEPRGIAVLCPAGTITVSGTGYATSERGAAKVTASSFVEDKEGWIVIAAWTSDDPDDVALDLSIVTIVMCAPGTP